MNNTYGLRMYYLQRRTLYRLRGHIDGLLARKNALEWDDNTQNR